MVRVSCCRSKLPKLGRIGDSQQSAKVRPELNQRLEAARITPKINPTVAPGIAAMPATIGAMSSPQPRSMPGEGFGIITNRTAIIAATRAPKNVQTIICLSTLQTD